MRSVRVNGALATAALLVLTALPAAAAAAPAGSPAGHLASAAVHTAGRVQAGGDSLRYSWPGVYFEGRFRGTGVGIVLNDAAADYDVQIDGATVGTLVAPGRITHWVTGLRRGTHDVRLVKRSESPWAVSEFGGFVPVRGGAVLSGPAPITAIARKVQA